MRTTALILLSAVSTVCAAGADLRERGREASADRSAAYYASPENRLAMYIWSDKYVYQPNETVVLRWTVKPNGDLYPYTIVAYRQNNQTGAKTYFPGGTADVTDIYGNTLAQGFQADRLPAAEKAVLLGPGGRIPADRGLIPNEPGMQTFVVQLRDYTGTRIIKTAYMKIGVVTGYEDIQGEITADRTLVNTKAYRLKGAVFVKNNATLTIEPGTFVIGQPGSQPPSVLVVTRNGKINASGTRSRPIVITSSQAFGNRQRGDWGGLILLGKAPINVGANASGGNPAGEFNIEGLTASEDTRYGGADANHSCGTLSYVRVEYAGSILSPANETNSFTFGGCGKGTVAHHLQAIYGLDDAFEWFGGTMDAKYLVGGNNADDYVDFQLGYTGRIQFGLFYQSPSARGNRGIEGDNSEYDMAASPRSNPKMYNLTFVGSGQAGFDEGTSPGIYLRRGAAGTFDNILVTNFYSTGAMVADATTQGQVDAGALSMNGILLWRNKLGANGANTLADQVDSAMLTFAQGTRGKGVNFVVAEPALRRPFEYSDPDWRGAFGTQIFRTGWVQPEDDGFFDQSATFIGGIGDIDWTEEWTSFLQDPDIKVQ